MTELVGHAFARASLDHCLKCTICETQCPVAAVTPLFPGPKYVGPQAERFRAGLPVDRSVDYCSSCGTCTLVCPQGVKIAELNSQARAAMKAGHMPLRDRLISQTTLMGTVMTPFAGLANWALDNRPIRTVVEHTFGIHRDAPMPPAQSQSFMGWWKRRPQVQRDAPRGQLVFFHGCAGGYFEVETSKCAVEVLEFLGYQVIVPEQGCCGLAMQSNGLYRQASAAVTKLAGKLLQGELPIVSASGSCTGMLKHEAREIIGVDAAEVAEAGRRIRDIMQFLWDLHEAGELSTAFAPINKRLLYHAPCQLKSQGMGMPALDVLRLIPGLEVDESGVPCCGIAGTYGLKKEKYQIAQAVGKPLFDQAKTHDLVVCDTETCRWQIRKSAGVRTEHPIMAVHQAYGLGQAIH
ncbi:MAG: anaerobic glycerol-3-phosphate dehydrogenase subunit C [Propionibacteriaceae bacterium]|jgi:glycerol-3-phosphate dehydrogenase subunit C|nr:anaerobic glycerol-3-phosphate dehydrogenase subunit C [Propionibacteriaceae bacterium]